MLVTLGHQRVKKYSKMKFFIIKFLFVIIFLDQNMYLNVSMFWTKPQSRFSEYERFLHLKWIYNHQQQPREIFSATLNLK